jgi:uncharacterized membrane protein YidH (DUF202 family)
MNVIHMIRRYRRLDEDSDEKPVYFSLWPRWVYVDNVGAVCRDTLSNERTNLAWVRTALSSTVLGFSIGKFIKSKHSANQIILDLIGVAFIISGLIMFWYSFIRTMSVHRSFRKDSFVADYLNPVIIFIIGSIVSLLSLLLLFL